MSQLILRIIFGAIFNTLNCHFHSIRSDRNTQHIKGIRSNNLFLMKIRWAKIPVVLDLPKYLEIMCTQNEMSGGGSVCNKGSNGQI